MILTANGHSVLAGSVLTLASRGNWTAPLVVDSVETVGPAVELANFDRSLVLKGTAIREGVIADHRTMLVVGGAGRLTDPVPKKGYKQISASIVINDVLGAVGEKLSPTSDPAVVGTVLKHWTRTAGTAERALDTLADHLGTTWRVLPDGTIYFGPLLYPVVTDESAALKNRDESILAFELDVEAPRFVAPCTFEGEKIDTVVHELVDPTRTTLFFGTGRDRGRSAFRALVAKSLPALDYYARYPAKVVSQNGDGTLELVPDDARIPNKSSVPILYGIPGVEVKVAPGARCTMGWHGADPERPNASGFEAHDLKEITLTASVQVTVNAPLIVEQNGMAAARRGDLVQGVSSAPGTPFIGTIITGNEQHRL